MKSYLMVFYDHPLWRIRWRTMNHRTIMESRIGYASRHEAISFAMSLSSHQPGLCVKRPGRKRLHWWRHAKLGPIVPRVWATDGILGSAPGVVVATSDSSVEPEYTGRE